MYFVITNQELANFTDLIRGFFGISRINFAKFRGLNFAEIRELYFTNFIQVSESLTFVFAFNSLVALAISQKKKVSANLPQLSQ